jgi:peptidoglycan/xylan/chitin deacetylase (PgdA/CDA1 family)
MRPIFLGLVAAMAATAPARALEPIPDKLVVLTFDDSSRSHIAVAAPLLKKHGFGATFFITKGFDFATNSRDYMTWDEIARLHRDGFEIGNHTRDHRPPSAKDPKGTLARLAAIDAKCAANGIPKPVSFAYPGNVLDKDVLPLLRQHGIQFARRGGAPEYPYDKGRGFAYEPGLDHPLLIPSAGDARPDWTLADFERAVVQARGGKIAVIQLHGVPDTAHAWVNTPTPLFESYVRYLAENHYKVIALRDLARYVDPGNLPRDPFGVIEDRKRLIAAGRDGANARPAKSDDDLKTWLTSMLIFHRYTATEAGAALGLSAEQIEAEARRLNVGAETAGPRPSLLPYPGGRHPRIGFLEGAIRPRRETKISFFAPWSDGDYAVVDLPEAVWHRTAQGRRKLLYLAHTHIPTIWDERGEVLPPLEWKKTPSGGLELTREFPNKIAMTSRAEPEEGGLALEFRVENGSSETLTGLDVQVCVMLRALKGFEQQTNENKRFQAPFAVARDATGRRWIIAAWAHCQRAWGNAPCPCLHSDPHVPDCPPGESRTVRGWVRYHEGTDIDHEMRRLNHCIKN